MAARGLITLFRTVNPKLLQKKDRGRPGESNKEVAMVHGKLGKDFGALSAVDFIPGAEILPLDAPDSEEVVDSNSDDEWSDVVDSGENFTTLKRFLSRFLNHKGVFKLIFEA